MVALYLTEACRFQRGPDLFRRIALHSLDDPLELLRRFIRSVRFIADQKCSSGFENSCNF